MSEPDDRSSAGVPPEGVRLVQEVQDLGFQAARTVVERFGELFDQFAAGSAGGGPRKERDTPPTSSGWWGSDRSAQGMQSDVQRAADSYFAVLGQLSDAGLRFLDVARWWQPPAAPAQPAALQLPDVAPGGRVSAKLWLHNTTAAAAVGLRPWCPGLVSHAGAAVPPDAVTCAPARIDRLEPDASAEVLVTATVAADATPGAYHGLVLVDGLPDVVFPLRLTVRRGEGGS